jgi:hypothetical protein
MGLAGLTLVSARPWRKRGPAAVPGIRGVQVFSAVMTYGAEVAAMIGTAIVAVPVLSRTRARLRKKLGPGYQGRHAKLRAR